MNDCVTCHKAQKATLECDSCHTGESTERDFLRPEFAVTHGPNWRQTHGMGQTSTCFVCHAEDKCSGCHGPGVPHGKDFIQTHGKESMNEGAQCTTCHRAAFCANCHQVVMPHPDSFAREHSKVTVREGKEVCLRCHDESDCSICHVRHVHPGGAVGNVPRPVEGAE